MNTRGVYTFGEHYHGVGADGSWHEPIAELSSTGTEGTLFDPSDDDDVTLYNAEPIPEAGETKPPRAPHQIAAANALKGQTQLQNAEQRAAAADKAHVWTLCSAAPLCGSLLVRTLCSAAPLCGSLLVLTLLCWPPLPWQE